MGFNTTMVDEGPFTNWCGDSDFCVSIPPWSTRDHLINAPPDNLADRFNTTMVDEKGENNDERSL